MELILFRHGPAEERDPRRWPDDDERPLTRAGVGETRDAARGLARLHTGIDRVITSPAARARVTAEIVRQELGVKNPLQLWAELAPDSDAAPILDRLARESSLGTPVLVGHEPTLGELASYAMTGDALSLVRLSRAGAVALEFERHVVPGGARIDWLLTRRQLALVRK